MKLPNKVTSFEESVLSKLCPILELLCHKDIQVHELYLETQRSYTSYSEFIDSLDCLFALGKIELLEGEEVLHYVA